MTETGETGEQPGEGTQLETTGAGLEGNEGQSVASTNQTTDIGTGEAETTFFDPQDLSPELLGQYKNMQRAFTEKTQGYAANRHKIEAFDAFEQNPQQVLTQLAQQYGYQLLQGGQQQQGQDPNWEPQNWDEVMTRAEEQARQKIMAEFEPVLNEVKSLKESSMIQSLDAKYPDWRTYENEMRDLVTKHPTMVQDLDRLYDMAVPPEVKKARATKAALAKIEAGKKGAQVSGQGTTTQPTTKTPNKPLSFQEAANLALQKVRGVS